jgi:hypothetical protein
LRAAQGRAGAEEAARRGTCKALGMAAREGAPQQASEHVAVMVLSWLGLGLARLLDAALPAAPLGLGLARLLGVALPAAPATEARERVAVAVLSWLGLALARLLGAALPAALATGLGLGLGLAWLLGWAPLAALGAGAVGPGGAARMVAARPELLEILAVLALGAAAMVLRGQLALLAYLCLLLLVALIVVRELKPARSGPGDVPAEPVQVVRRELGRERRARAPPDADDMHDRLRLWERRLAARAAEAEVGQEAVDYDDASGLDSGSEHESEDDALAPAPMPLPAAPDYANMTERQIKKATRKREKAEQRLARAEAIRQSEERKATARSAYGELQALREDERLERERALEEERQAQLRQEEAQYRQWRGAIRVEGSGEAADAGVRAAALDAAIVQFARLRRVLVLDDVAEDLGVRTSELLERVEGLRAAGSLRGVLDDRGKFVVVSDDDLDRLAAFVRQRGRVSLSELARHSNELIVGLSSA